MAADAQEIARERILRVDGIAGWVRVCVCIMWETEWLIEGGGIKREEVWA